MSGRKVFTAGEVLQAADVNDFLMDQSVMVFAGTAARGSAIPSPTEGMVTYRSDDDVVEVFDGSVFKAVGPGQILQVVSTTITGHFSTASTSYTDVTGLTASITPSSASNKVYVAFVLNVSTSATDSEGKVILLRDSTAIDIGTDGNEENVTYFDRGHSVNTIISANSIFLDAPSTTSAVTYKLQAKINSGTLFVNRRSGNNNEGLASTITLMEVAG